MYEIRDWFRQYGSFLVRVIHFEMSVSLDSCLDS